MPMAHNRRPIWVIKVAIKITSHGLPQTSNRTMSPPLKASIWGCWKVSFLFTFWCSVNFWPQPSQICKLVWQNSRYPDDFEFCHLGDFAQMTAQIIRLIIWLIIKCLDDPGDFNGTIPTVMSEGSDSESRREVHTSSMIGMGVCWKWLSFICVLIAKLKWDLKSLIKRAAPIMGTD